MHAHNRTQHDTLNACSERASTHKERQMRNGYIRGRTKIKINSEHHLSVLARKRDRSGWCLILRLRRISIFLCVLCWLCCAVSCSAVSCFACELFSLSFRPYSSSHSHVTFSVEVELNHLGTHSSTENWNFSLNNGNEKLKEKEEEKSKFEATN